jgi:hypothetical protein
MKDKKWIIPGLIIAVGIFTFPFWYNLGHKDPFPNLVLTEKAKDAETCILPGKSMRARHMHILDEWRDLVVRDGIRIKSYHGKQYHLSLSNTCLDCHSNKEEFCDRCHNYASVRTYCWDCHVNPGKGLKEITQWKTAEEISLR